MGSHPRCRGALLQLRSRARSILPLVPDGRAPKVYLCKARGRWRASERRGRVMSFQDDEATVQAIAQFTWRGELEAFIVTNETTATTIPRGNPRFDAVAARVAAGQCDLLPPRFGVAYETMDGNGHLTGHNTSVGFVPLDPQNPLRVHLIEAIRSGDARVEPFAGDRLPRLSHVVFCIPFDRPWPHLSGVFHRTWRYRSTPDDKWLNAEVRIRNLPDKPHDTVAEILNAMEVQIPDHNYPSLNSIQNGIIEIEFRVRDLWSLYRTEERAGFGLFESFIKDRFEMDLVRDGRTRHGGPRTQSLIQMSPDFLRRAAVDIANDVTTEFNRDYGGDVVGFVTEEKLYSQRICFGRKLDGGYLLLSLMVVPTNSFKLCGTWHGVPDQNEYDTKQLSFPALQRRIKSLITGGFSLEALSLANGFFELVARAMVAGIVAPNAAATEWVAQRHFTYDRSMEALEAVVATQPDGYIKVDLCSFLERGREIYQHRNMYMHALKSATHEITRSVDLTRQATSLLTPLINYFESGLFLNRVSLLAQRRSPDLNPDAVAAATAYVLHDRESRLDQKN